MTNQPPLNPDALWKKIDTFCENMAETGQMDRMEAIDLLHEAQNHLAVAQPVDMPGTYMMGTEEEALKSHERRLAMKAQPVVNSVEELDALPIGSVIMPLFHEDESVILKDGNGDWAVSGHPHPYDTKTVFLGLHGKGARVISTPEVNDA